MIYLSTGIVAAQTLKASGPDYISVGDKFRIEYVVNAESMDHFQLGDYPHDAFKYVYGPATSMSTSMTSINGKSTYNSQLTYIYTFIAQKAGTFTFKGATAKANGKSLKSNDVRIIVSDKEKVQAKRSSSSSEVFVQVSASKTHVVEQEPIILTYRLYTAVNLSNIEGELPDLTDFTTYPLTDPRQQVSRQMETINGIPYIVVNWREYLLFPQQTGRLEIPSIPFNVSIVRRQQNIDPFEAFMNGGSSEIYDERIVSTEKVHIQVDALANKPADFSGGVGQFKIDASIDNTQPKTNEVVTIKVKISGHGNLNMVTPPTIAFPSDFDTYEPQTTDTTQVTPLGIEGAMEYEYTAVPRNPGKYDIPPITFTYYDTEAHDYKTLTTEGFHLDVAKGAGSQSSSQSFDAPDDNDIYPIHQGDSMIQEQGGQLFGSQKYLLTMGIMLLVFFSLFIIFRQRAIDNADIVKNRGKRANKVATKRLKKAAVLMKNNKPGEFYDETLRALWGYVGDKLNMPVEQLSRENITERLLERNVEQETTTQFVEAIDECEFERYAPGDPKGNMNKVYEKAMTAIEHIENNMKRKVKKSAKATLVLMLLMLSVSSQAMTKQDADQAYRQGNYQQAIEMYESLLKAGVSADIYYNLGNAYYRTDQLTQAILNYERALLLAPSDADIRHNLQFAQSKTVDKITPESEMFFVTWYHSLVRLLSSDAWAYLAIASLALVIVLALLYLFAGGVGLRKVGFFGGIAFLVLFLLANLFAWQQKHEENYRNGAVIMATETTIMNSPSDNGKSAFKLHEGTTVTIVDDTMADWKQISVADGRKGWIKAADIEKI